MSSVPGPRTNPTVKSLANTNQRSLRSWQLTLGPVQTVILLGLFTGCLACSFYLGFCSGTKQGVETALNNSLSTAIRLPIEVENRDGLIEDGMQDVYARLNDGKSEEKVQAAVKGPANAPNQKSNIPEIGSIQSTDEAPLADALNNDLDEAAKDLAAIKGALKGSVAERAAKVEAAKESVNNDTHVRILGEKPAFGFDESAGDKNKKTLGALMRESGTEQEALPARLEEQKSPAQPLDHEPAAAAVPAAEKPAREKAADKKPVEEKKLSEQKVAQKPAPKAEIEPEAGKVKLASAAQIENAKLNLKGQTSAKAADKSVALDAPLKGASIPKGWFAQIIAPKSLNEAEGMARKLKGAGFAVVIESAVVRDENYYRVLVGPESSRQHAERLVIQLKREPYIKSEPFLRVVK